MIRRRVPGPRGETTTGMHSDINHILVDDPNVGGSKIIHRHHRAREHVGHGGAGWYH